MFHSGNPALKEQTFEAPWESNVHNQMSLEGVANKTGILLGICTITAVASWMTLLQNPGLGFLLMIVGVIGGLVLALVTIFSDKKNAVFTAPLYAGFEGLFLGPLSGMFGIAYEGIVWQAIALTFGVFLTMLLIYRARLIQATENFRIGMTAAIGAVVLIYLVSIIANMFGGGVPYLHGNGFIGIGFSLVVVVIAALTFVLDFDFIENGVESGAPKHLEWYAAFGLMVTLIWLYVELLRLLAKIRSR